MSTRLPFPGPFFPAAASKRFATILLLVGSALSSRAAVTTEVTFNDPAGAYTAYYQPLSSAVQAGLNQWTASFTPDLTVHVTVRFTGDYAGSPSTGRSVTNVTAHTNGNRRVQMEGLAAKLTGLIPASSTAPDVDFFVEPGSLKNDLWFDPQPGQRTATVPGDKTDAVSLFTNLFGYALGFNGFFDQRAYTLPDSYESAFDEHVVASGANQSFNGAGAVGAYGGPVPLTSGFIYTLGNVSPLPGSDLEDDVMNGIGFAPGKRYLVSALDRAILADTGLILTAASLTTVSVAATTPVATVGGAPGVYTFSIPAALPTDLKIAYAVKGQAANGVDYAYLKGTIKLKAGATTKTLKIKAQGDLGGAAKKTLKLSLSPGTGYSVGTKEAVKLKLVSTP